VVKKVSHFDSSRSKTTALEMNGKQISSGTFWYCDQTKSY